MITPNQNEKYLAENLLDEVLALPLREAQVKALANAIAFARWLQEQETARVRRTADSEIARMQIELELCSRQRADLERHFVLPKKDNP